MNKEEFERIKNAQNEAFIRIDKNKDRILSITEKQGEIIAEIKDNKIDDLMSNEELNNKIKEMASKSGRKTSLKWLAGIIPLVEILRKLLQEIL